MFNASFPMYNFSEIEPALSTLWQGIATHLDREGVKDLPTELSHGKPLAELLSDKNLLLSQCCGYDVVSSYRGSLQPLAVPLFDVEECSAHEYSSLIVVHEDSLYDDVLQMRDTVAVANGPESHSGMSSLRHQVAAKHINGRFFSDVFYSGSHRDSLLAIRDKTADVAAIDSVTYKLLKMYRPYELKQTRVIGMTVHAPAPPYVTHVDRGSDTAERVLSALLQAFEDPNLAAVRADLLLKSIVSIDLKAYQKILDLENYAKRMGYVELG